MGGKGAESHQHTDKRNIWGGRSPWSTEAHCAKIRTARRGYRGHSHGLWVPRHKGKWNLDPFKCLNLGWGSQGVACPCQAAHGVFQAQPDCNNLICDLDLQKQQAFLHVSSAFSSDFILRSRIHSCCIKSWLQRQNCFSPKGEKRDRCVNFVQKVRLAFSLHHQDWAGQSLLYFS